MGCNIKRVITINSPVKWSQLSIIDESGLDIADSSLYSWSCDGVCWTSWTDHATYDDLAKSIETDYYLRFLISGGIDFVVMNGERTDCFSKALYSEQAFTVDLCANSNLFNPYANLDCALQLQQQLSDAVVCMFGIPCWYFKVAGNGSTKDLTFKEYVLHSVESVKTVKLMLEDGALPSSNPQMTEIDFDWDRDWQVELSKTEFSKAFGDSAFPRQRDFIYVPMMKRMYEVNSAYDEKAEALMWRASTWKLGLIKWSEKTSVDQRDFSDLIDTLVENKYDDVFGNEREEQRIESGADHEDLSGYTPVNLYALYFSDAVRKTVSDADKTSVVPMQINHKSLICSRMAYDFKTKESQIEYQHRMCGDSGSVIILASGGEEISDSKRILRIGDIDMSTDGSSVSVLGNRVDLPSSDAWIIILRWSRDMHTVELQVWKHCHDSSAPKWALKPEMHWFDKSGSSSFSWSEAFYCDYDEIVLSPWPFKIAGLKVFGEYIDEQTAFKEAVKYSTTDSRCVVCDNIKPMVSDYGYSVR